MASYFNLTLDTTAPSGLSITLNDSDIYTTTTAVTLAVSLSDEDTNGYQMKVWGTADAAEENAATWETYQKSSSITLPTGDGLKTVYVKVRDAVGNETTAASDTITLDTSVPTVSVTGPDKSVISEVDGFNTAIINFMSDVVFEEYKVCVVASSSATQADGTVIPTTAGSTNTSGSEGGYEADTNIQVTIKGTDLETASSGDGVKIVKVFVRNAAGTWSVA